MTEALQDAKKLIEQRLRELDQERERLQTGLRRLDDAQAVVGGGRRAPRRRGSNTNSSARRSAGRGPSSPKKRQGSPRRRVAPRGQRRQQLVDFLKKSPGSRPNAIAKALGISPSNTQNVLRTALAEGAVEKVGSSYSLVAGASAD